MDKQAFTLLEVIITIVVLVVGMVSILNVFSTGIFADSTIEDKGIALYLAQEKMEEIRDASAYDNIDDDYDTSGRVDLAPDFPEFEREVTVSADGTNPREVNVNIYWNVKGDEQSITLVSLFADYDY